MKDDGRRLALVLALVGAGEGLLLGKGLELCFGIGQYRLIMAFGALGGLGIGVMTWLTRAAAPGRIRRNAVLAGAGAGALVLLVYFLWRVLPLVREEIAYYG